MRIQYWGTAAAEAYPAMFCTCEACCRALEKGGKNIRTRASALIDQSVMIDFSPDTNYNRLRYGYRMSQLQALCITHAHSDHLSVAELMMHALNPYCRGKGTPLPVFCGADCEERILQTSVYDGVDPALTFGHSGGPPGSDPGGIACLKPLGFQRVRRQSPIQNEACTRGEMPQLMTASS